MLSVQESAPGERFQMGKPEYRLANFISLQARGKCKIVCYCRKCLDIKTTDRMGNPFPPHGRQVCLQRYLPGGKWASLAQ